MLADAKMVSSFVRSLVFLGVGTCIAVATQPAQALNTSSSQGISSQSGLIFASSLFEQSGETKQQVSDATNADQLVALGWGSASSASTDWSFW